MRALLRASRSRRGRVGEILQQVGFDIEADDKRQVLGAQNLAQEIGADFLLHLQNPLLAAAGIDQNAQGQRQIGFGGEILDGLQVYRPRGFESRLSSDWESGRPSCL